MLVVCCLWSFDRIRARAYNNAGVARELTDAGDYAASAELSVAALRRAKSLPIDLAAGKAVRNPSDFGNMADSSVAESVAKYLLAAAEHTAKNDDVVEVLLQELSQKALAKEVQPYVFASISA